MFYTSELRLLRRKKNKAHKKAKNLNTPLYWEKFREVRNLYNGKIKEAKINAEEKQANDY